MAEAYEIEKSKAYNQQTYNEARQTVIEKKNLNSRNSSTSHVVQAEIHHAFHSQVASPKSNLTNRYAYADVVKHTTQQNASTTRNMSTQTEECDSSEFLGRTFFDKSKYCLIELFQSSIMKENSKTQKLIIDNVFQH